MYSINTMVISILEKVEVAQSVSQDFLPKMEPKY